MVTHRLYTHDIYVQTMIPVREDACRCNNAVRANLLALCYIAYLHISPSRYVFVEGTIGVVGPFISRQVGGQTTVSIYIRLTSLIYQTPVLIIIYRHV